MSLMKIGASTLFDVSDQVKSVDKLRDLSIYEIEICLPTVSVPIGRLESISQDTVKQLRKFEDCKFSVHTPFLCDDLGHPDSEIRKTQVERVIKTVDLTHQIGGSLLNVHAGYATYDHYFASVDIFNRYRIPREKYLGWVANSLTEIQKHAGGKGVLVSVENLGPDHLGRSPQEIKHILSKLNHKIGFTLDVGHANLTGNLWGYLRDLGKQISHVHLHDNDGKEDRHWRLGKGNLDLDKLLECLHQIRYKGNLVLEMNYVEDVKYSKALVEDKIRHIL